MRIISWNCAVASQENIDLLMGLNPDVAVVPECSRANIRPEGKRAFGILGGRARLKRAGRRRGKGVAIGATRGQHG
jgi:hypothetical protein